MGSGSDQYNIAAIRNLLRDAFTADTLWRFCQDRADFRPVLFEIGRNASLAEMIDVVLEHCRTQLLFDALLSAIREVNPSQYERYKAGLYTDEATPLPTPQIPHNLPPRSEFVGRDAEKARIHEALRSRYFLISIEGIGGIGKTSLALEVAYECLHASQSDDPPEEIVSFNSVVWTTAKDRGLTLNTLLDAVALTLDYPGIVQRPLDQKRLGVDKLLRQRPCLLILDNFETVTDDAVRDFLRYLPEPSKALVTTREQKLAHAWAISLKGLKKSEALALIRGEGKRLGLASIKQAEDKVLLYLHQATGGAPLALKWAVGQIKQRGQSLDAVLTALHEARGSVFEEIFARSWDLLSVQARDVLLVMPLFATSASREAIEAVSNVHHFALDEALGQLVEMSLLDASYELELAQQRYAIHPLTRAFVSAKLQQVPQTTNVARQRLVDYFREFVEMDEGGHPRTRFEPFEIELPNLVAVILWCWEEQLVDTGATILRKLRYFMIHSGYWNDLMDLSQRAMVLAVEHGKELVIAESWYSMGWVHRLRDDLDSAEQEMLQALDIFEKHGQTRKVAGAKRHLGRIVQIRGELDQAESLYREALALYQLIPHHYNYHWVMIDLASLAIRRGELDLADELCVPAREYALKFDDNEVLARIFGILSRIEHCRGNLEQAQEYAQKSLDFTREGGRRDAIAKGLLGMARIEQSMDRSSLAQQHLLQAIEIFEKLDMPRMVQVAEDLLAKLREANRHE